MPTDSVARTRASKRPSKTAYEQELEAPMKNLRRAATRAEELAQVLIEEVIVGLPPEFENLQLAIDEVQNLLEGGARGRAESDDHETSARDAGYLLGVQVGLRLRRAGA